MDPGPIPGDPRFLPGAAGAFLGLPKASPQGFLRVVQHSGGDALRGLRPHVLLRSLLTRLVQLLGLDLAMAKDTRSIPGQNVENPLKYGKSRGENPVVKIWKILENHGFILYWGDVKWPEGIKYRQTKVMRAFLMRRRWIQQCRLGKESRPCTHCRWLDALYIELNRALELLGEGVFTCFYFVCCDFILKMSDNDLAQTKAIFPLIGLQVIRCSPQGLVHIQRSNFMLLSDRYSGKKWPTDYIYKSRTIEMLPPSIKLPVELFPLMMDYPRFTQKPRIFQTLPVCNVGAEPRRLIGSRPTPGSGLGGARREAHGAGVLRRLRGLRVEVLVCRMVDGEGWISPWTSQVMGHGVC